MRTRFAPSPTGPLHLGHAYAAGFAHRMARASDGAFLLRFEDIDQSRARAHWYRQIEDDLRWLGFEWDGEPIRQSQRLQHYDRALDMLWDKGLLYQCDCNRRDIQAALQAPQEGSALHGPDGVIYPGTCREKHPRHGPRPRNVSLRLDMKRALSSMGGELTYEEMSELGCSTLLHDPTNKIGDIIVARKDMGTSYHLSVVIDDALSKITHVTRGSDLRDATVIHVVLQRLLNLSTPIYFHHRLVRDEGGKRLAKRDNSRAISTYREDGVSAEQVLRWAGL